MAFPYSTVTAASLLIFAACFKPLGFMNKKALHLNTLAVKFSQDKCEGTVIIVFC